MQQIKDSEEGSVLSDGAKPRRLARGGRSRFVVPKLEILGFLVEKSEF
jgi:hypothetical protein